MLYYHICGIVDNNYALYASVEARCDASEALLSRSVPLKSYCVVVVVSAMFGGVFPKMT